MIVREECLISRFYNKAYISGCFVVIFGDMRTLTNALTKIPKMNLLECQCSNRFTMQHQIDPHQCFNFLCNTLKRFLILLNCFIMKLLADKTLTFSSSCLHKFSCKPLKNSVSKCLFIRQNAMISKTSDSVTVSIKGSTYPCIYILCTTCKALKSVNPNC